MKKQDIFIMLKLASMQRRSRFHGHGDSDPRGDYTARGLSSALGVSKSEVNASIRRNEDTGLIARDSRSGVPKVNRRALSDFLVHGIKYVFPAKPGRLARGVPTAYTAPVFGGKLLSLVDYGLVWPHADGSERGESIEPLFRTVPEAALKDENLYACLALVDSIRIGNPREAGMAAGMLKERLTGDG